MELNELLLEAVRCGMRDQVAQLIRQGADINYTNAKGWTPLGLAVAGGQEVMAAMLASAGARTNVVSPNGQNLAKLVATG